MTDDFLILSGSSHPKLAESIGTSYCVASRFKDGEIKVEIEHNVRGKHVYLVQSMCHPVNDHIVEALVIIDALKRASAATVNLVAPYFAYTRQDRKQHPRAPISAKLMARLFQSAGIDRFITFELHNGSMQGFFDVPVDHIYALTPFRDYLKELNKPYTIVSPDIGGVHRVRQLGASLDYPIAIIDKIRTGPGQSQAAHLVGDVKGRHCMLVDDIVDSGNSLINAAHLLFKHKAKSVSALVAHGVLSGDALHNIQHSPLESLVTTDSIPVPEHISKISIAWIFHQVIQRIHQNKSVSGLFDER